MRRALGFAPLVGRPCLGRDFAVRRRTPKESYGASLGYDLGGGARVSMGVARSYGSEAVGTPGVPGFRPEIEAATLADFGISMRF